jgi:hypothetical protein
MTDQKSHQTSIPQADLTISNQPLDAETFLDLATRSGWRRMTQNALEDEKRKPFVLHPQPVVITWKSKDGEIIGAISGTNYGAYAFLQAMMIPVEHQGKGYGTQLLEAFQAELIRQNGGETSIALLAHPESRQYYLNRGFIQLQNGLVLKRGCHVSLTSEFANFSTDP